MDVKLDSNTTVSLEGTPANLLSLVDSLSEHLKKQHRVIRSLSIDGVDIQPQEMQSIGERPVDESADVVVTSEEASAFAARLLDELEDVLPELPAACHALAAVFQGNEPTEGYEPFRQLTEIWSVVKARQLEAADALDFSLEEVRVEGMSMQRMHEELNNILEEAGYALQTNDCVLLGDLLEYELAPRAQQEAEIASALRQRIAQLSA
jgi:hypothetical protein